MTAEGEETWALFYSHNRDERTDRDQGGVRPCLGREHLCVGVEIHEEHQGRAPIWVEAEAKEGFLYVAAEDDGKALLAA